MRVLYGDVVSGLWWLRKLRLAYDLWVEAAAVVRFLLRYSLRKKQSYCGLVGPPFVKVLAARLC